MADEIPSKYQKSTKTRTYILLPYCLGCTIVGLYKIKLELLTSYPYFFINNNIKLFLLQILIIIIVDIHYMIAILMSVQ